jgi:hypothetical protein
MAVVRDEIDIPMPAMGPASYRVPHRRTGMDPNTKRLALIAGGIGGLLVLLVGAWSAIGHRHGGVPVIEPDAGPVKVKPDNPGGMKVAGQNEEILSGASDDEKTGLAPPPEAPDPQALKAAEQKAAVAAAPPAPAAPAAPPAAASAPPATPAAPPVQAATAPEPKPAPAKPAATAKATAAPAGHGAQVQLAAMASEELARAEWQRLERKMPAVLSGHKPEVSRFERDGKIFWRLRTGGFASAADATRFCDEVKGKGANCAVASF